MTSPQAKLSKMDEAEAQKLIEQIDQVQTHLDRINELASEEILKVEIKYNKQRQPHNQKRSDLISKLPQFWLTVFLNHPQLSGIIEQDDEGILRHLRSLEIEDSEDVRSGYSIKLTFDENPYFENDILIKEFNISEACEATSKSTPIKWKPGKNVTEKEPASFGNFSRKRDRNACGIGFFAWFQDSTDAGADEIGEIIKDDIYINPLQYYLVEPASAIENEHLLNHVGSNNINTLEGNGVIGPDGSIYDRGVEGEDLEDLDEDEEEEDDDEEEDEEEDEEDGPIVDEGFGPADDDQEVTDEQESNPAAG